MIDPNYPIITINDFGLVYPITTFAHGPTKNIETEPEHRRRCCHALPSNIRYGRCLQECWFQIINNYYNTWNTKLRDTHEMHYLTRRKKGSILSLDWSLSMCKILSRLISWSLRVQSAAPWWSGPWASTMASSAPPTGTTLFFCVWVEDEDQGGTIVESGTSDFLAMQMQGIDQCIN